MLPPCSDRTYQIDIIKLKFEFEIKDLGRTKRILGMKIKRDGENYTLHENQCLYVNKVL